MPLSKAEANTEIKAEVNKELLPKSEGVRINNRNLDNVHPTDCQCTICFPYYPKGIPSQLEEERQKERLDYPE